MSVVCGHLWFTKDNHATDIRNFTYCHLNHILGFHVVENAANDTMHPVLKCRVPCDLWCILTQLVNNQKYLTHMELNMQQKYFFDILLVMIKPAWHISWVILMHLALEIYLNSCKSCSFSVTCDIRCSFFESNELEEIIYNLVGATNFKWGKFCCIQFKLLFMLLVTQIVLQCCVIPSNHYIITGFIPQHYYLTYSVACFYYQQKFDMVNHGC